MRIIQIGIAACLCWLGSPLLAAEDTSQHSIYKQKCSRCHKLPEVGNRTLPQWQIIIDVMQQIMAHKGVSPLNDTEKQQVLNHLKQNARQMVSEQASAAEDTFVARCTLCHQLPEPTMLKPKQWGLIMQLMQQRMQQANVPQLGEQEFDLVLKYLQERARN